MNLLVRLPALTTATGPGFAEYIQKLQVGLHPTEEASPVPYNVFINVFKNRAIERSSCEECEEVDGHGGSRSRETGRSRAVNARTHPAANP